MYLGLSVVLRDTRPGDSSFARHEAHRTQSCRTKHAISSFSLCNLTPSTKPNRREIFPRRLGFTENTPRERRRGQTARQIFVDLHLSMDPHNRRGSASFSTFLEDQPSYEGRNDRDLLPFIRRFYLVAFPREHRPWNVSIHELKYRTPRSELLASILFRSS